MKETKTTFAPMNNNLQPSHTKMKIKCYTCKKAEVCGIKNDYLKTINLIEEIIGAPADNYALCEYPNFIGVPVNKAEQYFPLGIYSNLGTVGKFLGAKFDSKNSVKLAYKFKQAIIIFLCNFYDQLNYNNVNDNYIHYKELFDLLQLKDYLKDPVADIINNEYTYKPICTNIDKISVQKIINIIDNQQDGTYLLQIPIGINCIKAELDQENNPYYPLDDKAIINFIIGLLNFNIKKENGIILLNTENAISFQISSESNPDDWNNTFTFGAINTLTFSQKIQEKILNSIIELCRRMSDWMIIGNDAYYPYIKYGLLEESYKKINNGLKQFYNEYEETQKKNPNFCDIINTTAFSASLDCKYYDQIKNLTYEDGVKYYSEKYIYGIPINEYAQHGDTVYGHLATLHVNQTKQCNCEKPKRRADLNVEG